MQKDNKNIDKQLDKIRHSLSHLMTMAIVEIYPKAGLGVGPVIENGFYQDYDLGKTDKFPITTENLIKIENRMRELIAQNIKFEQHDMTFAKALALYKKDKYKTELIKELKKKGDLPRSKAGKKVSFYKSGDFDNLCAGPHIKNTSEINPQAFKLTKVAGAYWRGNEKNKMLTRIYGIAFNTKEELDNYVKMQEEAEKRDHRMLGEKLKIFTFSEMVGPGLPLWLPNGTVIIEQLENLAKEMEKKGGYSQVKTPHIAKEIMYKTSGHLPYYADSMFPPMVMQEEGGKKEIYYLKAMNCPHHHQIFKAEQRSYKNLPLRLAEYGTCYRYEKSGELFGLMRVRSMQMNDAHIYCTEEQFAKEFLAVVKLYLEYFKIFGIEKYIMRLSTHSKEGLGKKYINNEKLWKKTEAMVRDIMTKENIPFVEVPNEAAFYGPKIDVQVWSAIGREFTLATNQVDFAVPERFGLTFIDSDGKEKTPICIHRAPLGTHERTIGFLIEHFAGAFPLWLSPVQISIIPISEKHLEYANIIKQKLLENNIRLEIRDEAETLGKKIRTAEMQKIPYLIIVGDKEIQANAVSVRARGKGDLGQMPIQSFIDKINNEIKNKL